MYYFKNIEFINFNNNKLISLFKLNLFNLILYVIYFVVFIVIMSLLNTYFVRSIFFMLIWFFLTYWLLSMFIFLYKKSQYTIYTRTIQRFWKRSLYLFWLIEFYLFGLYLFLTLISPQEVMYLLDNIWSYYSFTQKLKPFFMNLFNLLAIIILMNIIILTHKYTVVSHILYFVLTLAVLFVLQDDFLQLYYINQYYVNMAWVFDPESKLWDLESVALKNRTYIHYIYLLIFLKFWHTLFIVGFFLFYENIATKTKKTSYNIMSSCLQNFYFLLFFGYILKLVFVKHYSNYIYEYVYYWFFANYHFHDLQHWYCICNYNYILFLLHDLRII